MTRASLVVAASLLGLSAGLFATFSYAVMPGLKRTSDATFVQSMRAINIAILNPVFAMVFAGAALATVAALVATWATEARPWLLAAVALYVLGAFVLTGAANVPLNNALEAGTDSAAELRSAFEDTWVAFNHARSVLTVAAFVCAVVATTKT